MKIFRWSNIYPLMAVAVILLGGLAIVAVVVDVMAGKQETATVEVWDTYTRRRLVNKISRREWRVVLQDVNRPIRYEFRTTQTICENLRAGERLRIQFYRGGYSGIIWTEWLKITG